MIPTTEVTRERETFLYSSCLFGSVSADAEAATGDGDTNTSLQLSWPPDPTLTAFAQLTLLKLNATRCLISLFDQKHQYIIAQASPSCALTAPAEQKETWLDGNAVPRHLSICDSVIRRHDSPSLGDAHSQTLPAFVVSDLREDARYCSFADVQDVSYKRFYAGVPIRSPSGIDIGVLCVFDEQPRPSLGEAQMQILQEMSRTIMGHLTTLALNEGYGRSERMLRGIGTFLRQKTAPYGLGSARPGKGSVSIGTNMGEEERDIEQQAERPAPVPLQSGTSDATIPPTPQAGPRITTGSATDETPETDTVDQPLTFPSTSTVSFGGELVQRQIGTIFSAAASLIQNSVEAHGVCFLDATVSYGNPANSLDVDSASPAAGQPAESQAPQSTLDYQDEPERICRVIGASLTKTGDSAEHYQRSSHLSVPESLLQRLLGHYPQGTIFNYDRSGAPICPDSDSDLCLEYFHAMSPLEPNASSIPSRQSLRREARRKDSDAIGRILPGARCVAFAPIWSSRLERWYVGSLAWTRNVTRAFTTENEVTYLQTFGATIMSEVARINTVAADKAKYDLLGSVSHELRSPLHGIIASAELLHDTDLESFQGDVLRSIESCGRTLLDVLDHLLDFTKFNRLNKGPQEHSSSAEAMQRLLTEQSQHFKSQMSTLTSEVQLDALVEETVESVFTGYDFHETSASQMLAKGDQPHRPAPFRIDSTTGEPWGILSRRPTTAAMPIFLDIDPNSSWHCCTQPGALRRVIMNLVGNSLKFTKEGWVHLRLQQEPVGKHVILTVSDTGRGISDEFLHNNMFVPFSQEDHLTPGAGLGLSLVHDIVEAYGGTVHIESQLGCGTVAQVTLPCHLKDGDSDQDASFRQHISALKGLRVSLLGFSDDKLSSLPGQTPFCEQTLMERLCVERLGLELIPPDATEVQPDLLVCPESALAQVVPSGARVIMPPIVVICHNALAAHTLSNSYKARGGDGVLECTSQPAGPRKVAKAMVLAMERNNNSVDREIPTDPTDKADLGPRSGIATQPSEMIPHDTNIGSKHPTALATRPRIYKNPSYETRSPSSSPLPSTAEGIDVLLATTKNRTRYLLVDDNKLNLKANNILVALMGKLKRDWKTAENGLEAVEAYTAEPAAYAGVLMDLSMPIMDGFEATRRIREYEKTQKLTPVTVIALTGLASGSAQQMAFASGIDVFITKPARLKELAEVVTNCDGI
ncbi:hypothetical protein PG995_004429 [Apiospora arundinis]